MNTNATKGRNQSTKPPPQKRQRPQSKTFARNIGAVASSTAPEKKNIDVASAPSIALGTTTWTTPVLLNPIVQGTGVSQRVGRRVALKSLMIRWNSTDTNATGVRPWRWALIYDRNPQGAVPAATDIFSTNSINGLQSLANADRFMILHDTYAVKENQYAVAGASVVQTAADKWFRKFPDGGLENIWTDAATGTIADISAGAIYHMMVAQNSAAGALTQAFTCRIRYSDQ